MQSLLQITLASTLVFGGIVASTHAQRREVPQVWTDDAGRVVVDGDRTYDTWTDYFKSPVFRAFGMRCGSPSLTPGGGEGGEGGEIPGQQSFFGSPADCGDTTNASSDYEPEVGALFKIPVVVHVIRNSAGTQGNVSEACVQNQIDILNEDFRAILGSNGEEGYDVRIEFFLAETDPSGNPTNGITYSNNDTWFNDGGSYWNTLAWDPSHYLNIYTNNAGGYLGYVPYLPHEGTPGAASDRVVCLWSAFGNCSTAQAPYNLGRTLTHEVGHYLGLLHTFDGGCGDSEECDSTGDTICDTNRQQNPNYGCPSGAWSCSSSDPLSNYMNYTDDGCMNQFTQQQARRIRCTIMHYRATLPCENCGGDGGGGDSDSDGDGVPNTSDNCPGTSNPDQLDSDGDGTGDACDGCPNDPNKTSPGSCGCGNPDVDSDGDGTLDCNDACPSDPYQTSASAVCGCGSIDVDWNGDGSIDCNGAVFNVGTFTLSGGQSANVNLPGYLGTMTGFAVAMDYTGSNGCWASDMVAAFYNGSAGIQAGGYNSGFGYPSVGDWSYDGSGSAAAGVYKDGMPGTLALPASGPLQFRIKNGWSSSGPATYANVRVILFGVTPDNPCGSLSASAATTAFDYAGSTGSVALNVSTAGGCDWTASSSAGWVEISGGSGSGNGAASFVVATNTTTTARNATITISNGSASDVSISISQNGNPCVADSDGDGVGDCDDGCPSDPNKTSPGSCGCGVADTDSDSDGTPDCNDGCPADPNKTSPGTCGCGVSDADSDSDGTPDCNDGCPSDPNKTSPGSCGCGVADTDSDSDGTPDCSDGCPSDPNKTSPGACGCGVADTDSDSDGTPDCDDGCPSDPDKTSPGTCGCGVADTDSDSDGTPDCDDGCPSDPDKTSPGTCGCGVPDSESASWYPDVDGDGYGDASATAVDSCVQPSGHVLSNDDCNDSDPAINPGIEEVCGDGIDNNCDGVVDETCDGSATFIGFEGDASLLTVDDVLYAVIDVYAVFAQNTVHVVNIFDTTISNSSGSAFIQNDFAGGSWSPSMTDPGVADIDCFVTIGGDAGPGAGNSTSLDPNFDGGNVAVPPVGAGWYNGNPTNLQGLTDASGATWVGRFVKLATSSPETLDFSGSVSFANLPDGPSQQETAVVVIAYPERPCTSDIDGNGVVDGGDLGLLLLEWGVPNPTTDQNGDGIINGADVGLMLLSWGPCL